MHVVIFEGSHWPDFAPFTLTRPVFLLFSGTATLLQKQIRATRPSRITLWVREEMADYVREKVLPTLGVPGSVNTTLDDEPALLLPARTLPLARLEPSATECVVLADDGLIRLAYASRPGMGHQDVLDRTEKWTSLKDLPRTMPQARFARHWGDFVAWNEESLLSDAIYWNDPPPSAGHHISPDDIHAKPSARVMPGAVIDASRGPVLLDEGCVIGANAVIEGPVYIGPQTRITPHAYIHGGVSLGPQCRVGGEVSNTIFIGHANKSHDGYMGDSYVGAWVNCGAGTTTSNLKSTYGEVRLTIGTRQYDSGRMFLGAGLGDHAKLATGTLLPSGAYVGAGSMLAVSNRAPKFTASFRFVTDEGDEPMTLDKAAEVAGRMQQRRGIKFDELDKSVLESAAKAAPDVER